MYREYPDHGDYRRDHLSCRGYGNLQYLLHLYFRKDQGIRTASHAGHDPKTDTEIRAEGRDDPGSKGGSRGNPSGRDCVISHPAGRIFFLAGGGYGSGYLRRDSADNSDFRYETGKDGGLRIACGSGTILGLHRGKRTEKDRKAAEKDYALFSGADEYGAKPQENVYHDAVPWDRGRAVHRCNDLRGFG